ncbi:BA75_00038T0 [Komagataella pastoris]|uniref:BA75_00038T0 n=1 Tax=Komagataella pastoris TaxID=4922 RepID=A0A1B2J5Z7_PICPA|nr:BA75_00038T0 [Komagataella pastoris]
MDKQHSILSFYSSFNTDVVDLRIGASDSNGNSTGVNASSSNESSDRSVKDGRKAVKINDLLTGNIIKHRKRVIEESETIEETVRDLDPVDINHEIIDLDQEQQNPAPKKNRVSLLSLLDGKGNRDKSTKLTEKETKLLVTLKISSSALKDIQRKIDREELYTPGVAISSRDPLKPAFSFLNEIQLRAQRALENKHNELASECFSSKGMFPPPLKVGDFLIQNVTNQDDNCLKRTLNLPLRANLNNDVVIDLPQALGDWRSGKTELDPSRATKYHYTISNVEYHDLTGVIQEHVSDLKRHYGLECLMGLFHDLDFQRKIAHNSSQWIDLFKPTEYKELLFSSDVSTSINNWIKSAFEKLQNMDRTKRKPAHTTKKPKRDNDLDNFIVYDDPETIEVELYAPLLIIEGPPGAGKSSSIFTIVERQMKGFVFEINTGESRARKDIGFHLEQIATTKLVKRMTKGYADMLDISVEDFENISNQKGVILFDDCDVDLEDDKDLFISIRNLLQYSHRPIILTCSDSTKIPPDLTELATVVQIEKPDEKLLSDYLYIIGCLMRFTVDRPILNELASHQDIRWSLMQLQAICNCKPPEGKIIQVKQVTASTVGTVVTESNIEQLERYYDSLQDDVMPPTIPNFDSLRDEYLEFYASKAVRAGSRKWRPLYKNSKTYLIKYPFSVFQRLSISNTALFTELAPIIRLFARMDVIMDGIRRFLHNPTKILLGLHSP